MDKPLPYSEDSERAVLCSLILAPPLAGAVRRELGIDYFYAPAHKILWAQLLKLIDGGKVDTTQPIDFNLVKSALNPDELKELGEKDGLNTIFQFIPTAINWRYYADDVREKWARRQKILACRAQERAAFDPGSTPDQWDPDGAYLGATLGPKLIGASFTNYSHRTVNSVDTLLGNRYLCRGGGLLIVAPSGLGKSVLTAQAAIQFGCGQVSFAIKPSGPLRSLVLQAEDDEGDVIEMSRIVNHLGLSPQQQELVGANTHVELVNGLTADKFLDFCDGALTQFRADLVWLNPYGAYLGADTKDEAANSHFLRDRLNPILAKHQCGAVIVHHTPKTIFRDTKEWKPSDWQYAGAGAAVLTNWARAVMAIDPTRTQGVYKFIAAKRGQRIGWGDPFPVFETYWSHSSDGKLLWVPATEAEIKASEKTKHIEADDLLELVPVLDSINRDQFRVLAKKKRQVGRDRADGFLNTLIESGKVSVQLHPRKGTNSERRYTRNRDFTGQESLTVDCH